MILLNKIAARVLVIVILFSLVAFGVSSEDAGILLPAQRNSLVSLHKDLQAELTAAGSWQNFTGKNGLWFVQWNEIRRNPHMAFGKAVQISGFSSIDRNNIELAARKFVDENARLLRASSSRLELVRTTRLKNLWYITFRQTYRGVPVLFSEVELRISQAGKVAAFGSDFYPEIEVPVQPLISLETAGNRAKTGIMFNPASDKVYGDGKLYILPLKDSEKISYRLVYKVDLMVAKPVGNYLVLVDARNGEVLWRHNKVRYANISISSGGAVQLEQPTDSFSEKRFPHQYVTVGGIPMITDNAGEINVVVNKSQEISAGLTGPFVQLKRMDGPNASFAATAVPGDSIRITWDDSNSHPAERDAFYHTNIVHDFVTAVDTNFIRINYSMPCAVNINNTCNAFWDGDGINFFRAGGGCQNTGQIPSVVYHEYGHGVNDKLYEQLGAPFGMLNGATHEGMADVLAAVIEDDPEVGKGFTGEGSILRNLDNTNRYPQDNIGEVHHDGQILAGAFWDIRKSLGLQSAIFLSHFAKYGLPDDLDNGVAFSEWYLATLLADDDDGDLGNGTPHFQQINDAFNKHGIGSALFMTVSFSHTPLSDTQDTQNDYEVRFSLGAIPLFEALPDSVSLHYSTDGFETTTEIPATKMDAGVYHALIPVQPAGTMAAYFISAYDPVGSVNVVFPAGAPKEGFYSFLIGFQSIIADPFEDDNGWAVGAPDDDAATGTWERAIPKQTSIDETIVQPGEDHTTGGVFCFVTGADAGSAAGSFDIDGGKTTLFSPLLALSGMDRPVIKYYKWYTNDKGAAPNQDTWEVDISNNGGKTWTPVENSKRSTTEWEKFQFFVNDYVTSSDSVMLRFVASDLPPGSLVEALLDDFEVLAVSAVTAVHQSNPPHLPRQFLLEQNYPNPFNPSTFVKFQMPHAARVTLQVFNTLGQRIKLLLEKDMPAGYHQVSWDGKDEQGKKAASGIYFYEMRAGDFRAVGKMFLIQ